MADVGVCEISVYTYHSIWRDIPKDCNLRVPFFWN